MKRASFLFFLFLTLAFDAAAQPPAQVQVATALGWKSETYGAFVMSLCTDTSGGIWVGTEDNGVFRHDPATRQWRNWTSEDGLGDNDVFALACDTKGRIWAGHLNHGVSVWNGTAWRNYDVLNGPLGERIYDIAVCPTDGDVWVATNAGLARYHAEREWLYYNRGTGLPADQISALAFDAQGTLFAGTHCDGLAIGKPADDYNSWRSVVSPFPKFPYAAVGRGLPGNIINDVLVMKNGMIFVATRNGLARSEDGGENWVFFRGANWQMRMDGIYDNQHVPIVETKPFLFPGPILIEDSVNCLAEDDEGRLWIGYDNKGCQARNPKTNEKLYDDSEELPRDAIGDCVRAILPFSGQRPAALYGRYGGSTGGLGRAGKVDPAAAAPVANPVTAHPVVAVRPGEALLSSVQKQLAAFTQTFKPGEGLYLGADWRTQGDWVGRYGMSKGVLCAMQSPLSADVGTAAGYKITPGTGPHFSGYDGFYSYVHELRSANPRVLFYPAKGIRRQAEWNDGTWDGAKYAATFEGPDLWVKLTVPEGLHRVALNFYNKDAHKGMNRYRDFIVQLKKSGADRDAVDAATPMAQARVRDFWGGVYQVFALQGPGDFTFKIARQDSHGTILQAVLIDRMDTAPNYGNYAPPAPENVDNAATALWKLAGTLGNKTEGAVWQYPARLLAYRALAGNAATPNLQANWRRAFPLWTPADRAEFTASMARLHPPAPG